ncbi:TPA: aspartate 1-decarboxylase autocleavage activator PanM [Providencia rettgeri]|uniref:aspartate 1-decarboxylase autocleavage activator PanM n=1 Tax=Providencia TaxID=586 RepID=UPI001B3745D9|nr:MULTISPECIES: aspartate 1-decarboxylase autocleavage activator PanM [Providencia]EMB5785728.1 aspartate 1-decarboxylase autocleavage activator PanM [Providencia rettgeri]MBQ0367081.1 aspartate 1-decarboxylase autocleavage activator PanM [Providencia rettgeri]HBC7431756.1 aspartate 1-decarboxylase autocleavage activator PanM [Providencia rettgeri]
MRLTIISLVNPTEQQYLDLHKIWPDQSPFELAKMCKSGDLFYAARFNERLLGAAKVTVGHNTATLQDFCVREVTRRRGVGSYLLEEICQAIPDVTLWKFDISEVALQEKEAMRLFLVANGFNTTTQPDIWEKTA